MDEKLTLLLIDDKEANIFALQQLLEKPERFFLTAFSGEAGLKLALTNPIDLIMLDVQMPGMDGFEVVQILKSNAKTKDIPIIFVSAEKKERHSVMKGFEEGAVDYLSKPLDPELTRAKVDVLLQLQIQKRQLIEKNDSLLKAQSEIRRLNDDLKENLKQLEIMNHELESFSYSVSHDLRAPLRMIAGYTNMVLEDYEAALEGDGKKKLVRVIEGVSKMDSLIEGLLEFSKLVRKDVRKTEIDMQSMVKEIINEMTTITPTKAEIQVNDLKTCRGDRGLITQVWVNLISNAIKYSSKKENPSVEIGCIPKESEMVYYVKDNGAGFDMQYAEKLFGVFQRLHKASDFEGTGVGLALVHRIVVRHGGTIWAEAKLNEGATFFFTIPHVHEEELAEVRK